MQKRVITFAFIALVLGVSAAGAQGFGQSSQGSGGAGDEGDGGDGPCWLWSSVANQQCQLMGGNHTTDNGLGKNAGGENHNGACYNCTASSTCHACSPGTSELVQAAYKSMLLAAGNGDVSALLKHAESAAGMVRINYERSSLQILSCDKSMLVGNIPLSLIQVAMLESSLKGRVYAFVYVGSPMSPEWLGLY